MSALRICTKVSTKVPRLEQLAVRQGDSRNSLPAPTHVVDSRSWTRARICGRGSSCGCRQPVSIRRGFRRDLPPHSSALSLAGIHPHVVCHVRSFTLRRCRRSRDVLGGRFSPPPWWLGSCRRQSCRNVGGRSHGTECPHWRLPISACGSAYGRGAKLGAGTGDHIHP